MTRTTSSGPGSRSDSDVGVGVGATFAIELVSVGKQYGAVSALVDVNLEIEPGEFVVLLGPSGCGKSTILKVIAGLEDATEGEVYINDTLVNYVRPKERDVSMVFQNYALYPHMTVAANLGFPLKMRGARKEEVARRVADIARLLELEDQLKKYPEQLSGGQRQRVALGRAITRNPVAFLMDEPLSNLDALLRVQMRGELLRIHRQVGKTTVYVTHDQVEAMTMADRIVVLKSGVVQQVGSPHEVYSRPVNTFVATFVGSPQMNLFAGHVTENGETRTFEGDVSVGLGGSWTAVGHGAEVTLGVRPEEIELVPPSTTDSVAGIAELVEDHGADDYVSVAIGGGRSCMVRTGHHEVAAEGELVGLRFPVASIHLFDGDGARITDQRA